MRFLILLMLVLNLSYGNTWNIKDIPSIKTLYLNLLKLDREQLYILDSSYLVGKDYDLGLTLAAIAWHESNFGKYMLNLADNLTSRYPGSYGPYHVSLKSIMAKFKHKNTWIASRTAERLMQDLKYSQKWALNELLYWKRYWKSKRHPFVWSKMVASYNNGYNSNSTKKGRWYLEYIKRRVKALKAFLTQRYREVP